MKDWEEKHKELCKEGREEWKKKEGAEARVETGLKKMEDTIQSAMKVFDMKPEKVQNLIEAKKMCDKGVSKQSSEGLEAQEGWGGQ